MTKIRSTDASGIDDRRGGGGGGGGLGGLGGLGSVLGGGRGGRGGRGGGMKAGGGLIGVIVLLAALILPKMLGGNATQSGVGGDGSQSADRADGTCSSELEQIVCGATNDVQAYWRTALPQAMNTPYRPARMVFFSGGVSTGCGQASSQTGPFYCPADERVYIDLRFMQQLEEQLVGNTADLAEQYIVAHEYGHHVQHILGISDRVNQYQQQDQETGNLYSQALELQADCYAGVWINSVSARGLLESDAEIQEGFEAAKGVGDDYIQSRSGGQVNPDSYTHGTSEQRQRWLNIGITTGDPNQCEGTFEEMGVTL